MKFSELKATDDNLRNTYERDSIGRNDDIRQFAELLDSINNSYSIALNGSWGSGKTFFIKQTKLFIDAHNNLNHPKDQEIVEIFVKPEDKQYKPQVTVYFDAWENDNDNDPALSLVYSIVKCVSNEYKLVEKNDYLSKAASILELFTGRNWSEVIDSFKNKDLFEQIREDKTTENQIIEFFESIIKERGDRLIIFIDELDRCSPSYAVRLLERIKHYFSNDKITFVFSINEKELQHTIKHFYGNDFDACRYLDRFFDLRLDISPVDLDRFFSSIGFDYYTYTFDNVCEEVIKYFKLSLRESLRYLKYCKIVAYDLTHDNKKYRFDFSDGRATKFCILYFVPVMIGLKIFKLNDYDLFIDGKDSSSIVEILKRLENHFFDELLNVDETYDSEDYEKTIVKLDSKIEQIYSYIFSNQENNTESILRIGRYRFNKKIKETLLRIVSGLSNYMNVEGE